MPIDRSEFLAKLKSALEQDKVEDAVQLLTDLHPADIADLLEALEESEKIRSRSSGPRARR